MKNSRFFRKEFEYINADWLRELTVACAIASHMGQWNRIKYSSIQLPKPSNGVEHFVHLCDYLASRKFLEVNFEKI